jgi:hypothetical protein
MPCAATTGWPSTPRRRPNWLRSIKARLLAAFYTDTDAWKGQIVSQARQALFQAAPRQHQRQQRRAGQTPAQTRQ